TTATVTAMPASLASATAVSRTLRAPAAVSRFPSATYMLPPRYILVHAPFPYRALPSRRRRHRCHARLVRACAGNALRPASRLWLPGALDVPRRYRRGAHRVEREERGREPEEIPGPNVRKKRAGRWHRRDRPHRIPRHRAARDAGASRERKNRLHPAARKRPGAVPAFLLRPERHQDRAELRRRRGRRRRARVDGRR